MTENPTLSTSQPSTFKRDTVLQLLTILALIAICLPAMTPLMHNQLPRSADGLLHLYRVIALDDSITRDATLYPRYASNLVYGYGAPLFNYFSPVAYYPAVLLHRVGMSYLGAWLAMMGAYTVLAAVGAYRLGKVWSNRFGGLVAATAYVYAPYFLFDTISRGTLTEVAALAVLPFALWALTRLAKYGTLREMALTTFIAALFIPLHNIITLHGGALLVAYGLLVWWIYRHRWRTLLLMIMAGGLALGISTFFWLPALGETSAVKIRAVTEALDFIDVTRSLRPLTDVLALPHAADPSQLQQPIPITISWVQILLAFAAVIGISKGSSSPNLARGIKGVVVFFTLTVVLVIFLNTPISAWFWRTVPGLDYTQFAWRTLGIGSLVLAMLAGIGAVFLLEWLNRNATAKRAASGMIVAAVMLYSLSWLYPVYVDVPANSVADTQAHERETGELALSSYSEYLPTWTQASALDPEKLRGYFEATQPVVRLTPPEGVTINTENWRGTSATLELTADVPATLVFDWLYLPGWQAHFTDSASSSLPLSVKSSADGLVSVDIPAGGHTLVITLAQTPLQQRAWMITLVAFGFWLFAFGIAIRNWFINRKTAIISDSALSTQHFFSHSSKFKAHGFVILIVSIGVLVFKLLVVDQTQSIWRHERFTLDALNSIQADFNREIALIAVERPEHVESGAEIPLTLFWRLSGGKIEKGYSSILELRDAAGVVVATGGSFMPGGLATSNWLPGYYVAETIDFLVQAGTPPGVYTLEVGLYDPDTQARLSVINTVGNPEDVKFVVGQIEIKRPSTPPQLVQPYTPAMINGEIGIAMIPALGRVKTAMVGDELHLNMTWYAALKPTQDYQVRFDWVNLQHVGGGSATEIQPASVDLTLNYPTTQWQPGDVWRGRYTVIMPADLEQGDYLVIAQVYDETGKKVSSDIPIDQLPVTIPQRTFDLPEMQHKTDDTWQNGIVLRGYNVDESVSILTLYWQTAQPINQSLRLFVHVLEGETIVAQWDGIPVDWTRPTTGWATGEIITTIHKFDVPLEDYTIRVGWYDPRTNQRILMEDGGDSWVIETEK